MEGDTAHVVGRLHLEVEGIAMSRMDVSSFRQLEDVWLGLLSGDIGGVAAALKEAASQPVDPADG